MQPAHLEGVGSIEGVANAKGELFKGLGPNATAVVNLDDARVAGQAFDGTGIAAKKLTWGRHPDAQVRLVSVAPQGREGLQLTIRFQGRTTPPRCASSAITTPRTPPAPSRSRSRSATRPTSACVASRRLPAHARRLQIVDAPHGVTVVDDCYNANPASMNAALRTVEELAALERPRRRAVAVLGDMLELGSEEREHVQMGISASDRVQLLALFGPREAGCRWRRRSRRARSTSTRSSRWWRGSASSSNRTTTCW